MIGKPGQGGLAMLGIAFGLSLAPGVPAYYTNQPAAIVLGQPDMISNAENQNMSTNGQTLDFPESAETDGTRLVVTDDLNNRVLIYSPVPAVSNASAVIAVGQPNLNASGVGITPNTLDSPLHATVLTGTGQLVVSDRGNNRVLIYNSLPNTHNASADVVIGQPDKFTGTPNTGGLSSFSLSSPQFAFGTGSSLLVSDYANNRVLIFNPIPVADHAAASFVIGQPDKFTGTPNSGGVSGKTLWGPEGLAWDGARLYIADYSNHRVLIFNSLPATDFAPADLVLGQQDMVSNVFNQGGVPSARTLGGPLGIQVDAGHLYISEGLNNRVLIFATLPLVNDPAADTVIGQMDMFHNNNNQGGGPAANTLSGPFFIEAKGSRLIVPDEDNMRVLVFNDLVPTPSVTPVMTSTPGSGGPWFKISHARVRPSQAERAQFQIWLAAGAAVRLVVYDLTGHQVAVIQDGPLPPGWSTLSWDGGAFGSGTYLAAAETGFQKARGKLVVIR